MIIRENVANCSVTERCLILSDPMDCSIPGFPVPHSPGVAHTLFHWVSDIILCCPLSLLPSIFPSIRVFSNELALPIRWSKYWSFNISTSNEHSGLIYFTIDWVDLAVQGTLKSLCQQRFILSKLWFFPVVIYRCESWTIKKAEH